MPTSAGSNRGRKKLPTNTNPAGTICVPVNVPADGEWIGLFLGAIHSLTLQSKYYRDAAHTAKVIAARWNEVYAEVENSVLTSQGCGSAPMPQTIVRQNATNKCTLEYSLDDGVTWIAFANLKLCMPNLKYNAYGELGWEGFDPPTFYRFPDGGYTPPSRYPEFNTLQPVVGASDEAKRCNASYGAAVALQALYAETWSRFVENTPITVVSWAVDVAKMFGEMLGAHWLWEYALDSYSDFLTQSDKFKINGYPDALIPDVQNILYCQSIVDADGIVTFDFSGVVADFGASVGDPYGGLNFILQLWLREDGLNYAGTVDYGVGDCSEAPCEQPTVLDYDFLPSQAGWEFLQPLDGRYTVGQGFYPWYQYDAYSSQLQIKVNTADHECWGIEVTGRYDYIVQHTLNLWKDGVKVSGDYYWNNSGGGVKVRTHAVYGTAFDEIRLKVRHPYGVNHPCDIRRIRINLASPSWIDGGG